MSTVALVGVVFPLILGVLAGTPPPKGENPLQDICRDVRKIQEDEGQFDKYYQCLVDTGPCTQDTRRLKDVIQEALVRDCARCSAAQRRAAHAWLQLAAECRPGQFLELEKRFDPEGRFRSKYKSKRRQGKPVPIISGGLSE